MPERDEHYEQGDDELGEIIKLIDHLADKVTAGAYRYDLYWALEGVDTIRRQLAALDVLYAQRPDQRAVEVTWTG